MKTAGRIISLVLAFTAVSLSLLANLSAQEFPESSLDLQFQMADDYAKRGQYQEALDILLKLAEEQPANLPVLELLQRVYTESKNYDKALEIVGRIENLSRGSTSVYLLYGDLFLKMGQSDRAREYLDKALVGNRSDKRAYPRVADVYKSNGIYDKAIETYLDAKVQFKDQNLFSFELGKLYEISRNYDEATREYYSFMTSDTSNMDTGERLIEHLIGYVESPEDILRLKTTFSLLAQSDPVSFRPRKYLADMLIRQDSLEKAYELYKEIDRLTRDKGSFLVFFAKRCLERQSPEIASRASLYVLDKYPGQPHYIQARYVLSSAYLQMGHADSAVAALGKILESTPASRDRVEASFAIGEVYLRWLKNPDSASVYLDQVLESSRISGWYYLALLRKGECSVAKGDLAMAETLYNQIDTRLLLDPDKEYLLWIRAQASFFDHRFEDAKKLYARLTVEFRKGMFVNDCLRKILMINENTGFDVYDLSMLADAEYLVTRSVYDSAEAKLATLSAKSGSKLADISTFRLGELYSTLGQADKAIAAFETVLSRFKDSFWRGESQKQIADIYLAQGDAQKAQEAYRRLLTDYEGVLLQEHAREKLRLLEKPQL